MTGARRTLRWILGLQIALALALAATDFARAVPPGSLPSSLPFDLPWLGPPSLEAPVAPGDQRRRFAPGDQPDLPAAGDMPSRLLMEQEGEILRLTGQIAPGDGARFVAWLAERPGGPAQVHLHSTGGSVADALEIGGAIRAMGLDTLVPEDRLCLSACPYILAGGVARAAGPDAAVGVHQHYHGKNTYLPAFLAVEDIQRGQAQVLDYLTRMGIDPRLMVPALSTPPQQIYVLLRAEMAEYRLITGDA